MQTSGQPNRRASSRRIRRLVRWITLPLAVVGLILSFVWPVMDKFFGETLARIPTWLGVLIGLCIVCYGVWDIARSYSAVEKSATISGNDTTKAQDHPLSKADSD